MLTSFTHSHCESLSTAHRQSFILHTPLLQSIMLANSSLRSSLSSGSASSHSGRKMPMDLSGNSSSTERMIPAMSSSVSVMQLTLMQRTSYRAVISSAMAIAVSDAGSALLRRTTKGFPMLFSSFIARSSGASYFSRGMSHIVPSVVTTMPTVECSVMTLCVPFSAASVMVISWSNHGVVTRRSAPSSNCPAAPSTM